MAILEYSKHRIVQPIQPSFIHAQEAFASAGDRLSLTDLKTGEVLRVTTARSTYFFLITEPRQRIADMWKQGAGKDPVPVQIMGCTQGISSAIDPRTLFCGGSLEYTSASGQRTHTTTAIQAMDRAQGKA